MPVEIDEIITEIPEEPRSSPSTPAPQRSEPVDDRRLLEELMRLRHERLARLSDV